METPKNRNWKVLKSEYLSSQPWFTVRREEVELPNGNRIPEYYIFEYPEWINVIAITKEQKFVFVSQYRHGLGITAHELCAGVCEKETLPHSSPPNGNCSKRPATATEIGAN